jgi:hypothetical protein
MTDLEVTTTVRPGQKDKKFKVEKSLDIKQI